MTRRSIIFRTVWAGIFLLCTCMAEAQSFKASHLKNAYERLQLRQRSPQDKNIVVRTDENGVIEHIGIPLFSAKMRTLLPTTIWSLPGSAISIICLRINCKNRRSCSKTERGATWSK